MNKIIKEHDNDIYLGRQPILDRCQRIVAYELLFRSSYVDRAGLVDPVSASAQVIAYAFGELGLDAALGRSGCFINVNRELLLSDLVELLPADRVTLEITEDVIFCDRVIDRCRDLKQMGYSLALDDFVYSPDYDAVFELIDVIKVDITQQSREEVVALAKRFHGRCITLLAEKVESAEEYAMCREAGYVLFQGYYFARPDLITGKRADASNVGVLRLMGLVIEDAETSLLVKALKSEFGLCYGLLRLANSVALGARSRIDTLEQAVMLLGRKQIGRWLQILLYARSSCSDRANPLLELAAQRSELMEQLALIRACGLSDRAHLIGILSLLDVLLNMPMGDIVEQLNLSDDLRRALLERQGVLGGLLNLVELSETDNFTEARQLLKTLELSPDTFAYTQIEAFSRARQLLESCHA